MGDYQPYRRLSGNPSEISMIYADQDVYERGPVRNRPKLGNTGSGLRLMGTKVGRPGIDSSRPVSRDAYASRQQVARGQVLRLVTGLASNISPTGGASAQTVIELETIRGHMITHGLARGAAWDKVNAALKKIERASARKALGA